MSYTCRRRSSCDALCGKATPENVFRLTVWYKGKREATPLPLISNGCTATLPDDQTPRPDASQCLLFYSCSPGRLYLPSWNTPPHLSPHSCITETEIQALNSSSNTSAPRAVDTNYRFLKWFYDVRPELLGNM
ncbi:hypothetical protein RSAG8_05167, partial [Rhizoctonia solani AG-8 WAC10335]